MFGLSDHMEEELALAIYNALKNYSGGSELVSGFFENEETIIDGTFNLHMIAKSIIQGK